MSVDTVAQSPGMDLRIIEADYSNERHARDIIALLDSYARDPMGGSNPLPEQVKQDLIPGLAAFPGAFSLLCYIDDQPVGLANCLTGFSTFKCAPLINIHDIVVIAEYRDHGIGQALLGRIEQIARQRGCCKLTLEVLEGNRQAQQAYRKSGFKGYELDPEHGRALFWEKSL